jgi:predicted hotdog family 3-hydroxylacyl-ACP dehydratase
VLDRAWICARIPHQGRMCLLDSVTAWSDDAIACRAGSHRDPDNPLREAGRLGAAAGIEYGAQTMAVHGALLAGVEGKPPIGYLASVRGVTLHVPRLDDLEGELEISAQRLSGDASMILYTFAIDHRGRRLLDGRAAVMLEARAGRAP